MNFLEGLYAVHVLLAVCYAPITIFVIYIINKVLDSSSIEPKGLVIAVTVCVWFIYMLFIFLFPVVYKPVWGDYKTVSSSKHSSLSSLDQMKNHERRVYPTH